MVDKSLPNMTEIVTPVSTDILYVVGDPGGTPVDRKITVANLAAQAVPEGTAVLSTGETGGTKFLREDGDGTCSWVTISGGGDALVANPLSQFAATTSAQLAGVISDETGSGDLVFATSPTLVTPALGTPASGVMTNVTGTAAGLTAGNVTTNANLTGHVTSVGNAAVLGSFSVAQLNAALNDGTINTPEGTAVLSTGEAGGTKFLREDGDGTCSWQTVSAGSVEGTAVLSTGEAGGVKFLREDGDNTCSWQVVPAASDTVAGIQENATIAETDTGTSTTRTVTPDSLAGSYAGEKVVQATVFDYTTDTATGDGKWYMHVPPTLNGMNLVYVHAEVITAGTTGTTDIQIANVTQAADMLSTKLTIDSAETGSDTAAAAAVIDAANDDVSTNDVLRIDVDAVSTTAAKGLIVTMTFQLP